MTLLALLLVACTSGGPLLDSGCASTAECLGELECSGPNDWQGCGMGPTEGCSSKDDCGTEMRCHVVPDSCSADGFGSSCDAPCVTDGCIDGLECVDGACRAESCADDPSICAPHQACEPSSVTESTPVYDQHDGCVDVACTDDAGCADGLSCVNAICQDGLGECIEVYAVP